MSGSNPSLAIKGTARWLLLAGCINGALAVILGAVGAHALSGHVSGRYLAIYETGNTYHFYHSLALIGAGLVAIHLPASAWIKWAGGLMLAGIVLFSGSLYLLALTGQHWLGELAPLGGTSLIVSWILFAIAIARGN
jgi:uncharacterized membrane protein YgdD (TMEM256/DUF423 family)